MAAIAALFFLFAAATDYQAEGLKALDAKQYDQAAQLFTQAVQADPKDYAAHFHLALSYSLLGKDAEAIPEYEKSLELKPKSAAAQLGLGRALVKLDRMNEAPEHFRQAAQLDAKFGDALLELAGIYEQKHQPDEAIAIYQKFPENVAAGERLGELLIESKRFGEAIPYLEKAAAREPSAANQLALATAYQMNKEPRKAMGPLEKAVALEPSRYELRMAYGRALRDDRQFIAAANQFAAAAKQKPDAKETWNELAGVLTLAEQYPQALAALDRVRALGQEIPGDHYLRAIILDKLQQYKPALESYQKFLASSDGKHPDEEFKARQRSRIIERILSKK